MITQEQLDELKKTVIRPRPSELWAQAFKEYNETRDKSRGQFPLGMGCRSCYRTVYLWHEKRLMLDDDVITISLK